MNSSFIQNLLRTGLDGYDAQTRQRLIVTNALSYTVAIMTIPYQIFYALWDWQALWLAILVFAPQIFIYASIPQLHRFGPNVGPTSLILVWITFALNFTYFFGIGSGLHFYFLPGATAGVLVFGARQWKAATATMVLGLFCFAISTAFFTTPAPFISVSDEFLNLMYYVSVPFAFIVVFGIVLYANFEMTNAEDLLQAEFARSETLLNNVLPKSIASELKASADKTLAKEHDAVSILFADIVNFTPRASILPAHKVVDFLNQVFTEFDDLAKLHKLEKIKTIGDAFMVAGGMPTVQPDHAERVARMALDILDATDRLSQKFGETVAVRIGMNTGPVVAGVIGNQKLFYDVWGDTVNTAARMESFGISGRIQVSTEVKDLLSHAFEFERRGIVDIKGLGAKEVWFLIGERKQATLTAAE